MDVEISLNKKSIEQARKRVLSIKQLLPQMMKVFMERLAKWIIDRADFYLQTADIGENVKDKISSSWRYEHTENGIKIINNANQEKMVSGKFQTVPIAVLVEFGVGIEGGSQPHPQATAEGYRYNVYSHSKFLGGYWSFTSTFENLDLPTDQVDFETQGDEFVFLTQGSEGVWYAFQAITDAKTELERANGGRIGQIWEEVKREIIK